MSCVICSDFYGATYEKNGRAGLYPVAVPLTSDADQGTRTSLKQRSSIPQRSGAVFTCDWVAPIDKLTEEYPMVLSTVR